MTPAGLAQLRADEGLRLHAYPDPLSGGEPWTCGYGCTGAGIGPHTVWTAEIAEERLVERVAQTEAGLTRELPWFADFQRNSPIRADVLTNMSYNLGVEGLIEFTSTLAAVQAGKYATAALDMQGSRWARQLPQRARRLAQQMRTEQAP